jgi:hypothetical protein
VYPAAQIQTCIVHLIRNSLSLASWKDRKPLASALKPIYQTATAEAAEAALQAFSQREWGRKFPTVAAMWQRQWEQVIPFFAYPPEVRKIIYTTNAIAVTAPATKPPANCCTWPCATSKRIGKCHLSLGGKQSISSPSCSASDSPPTSAETSNQPQHTKFLTR